MWVSLLGLIIGIVIGWKSSLRVPPSMVPYMSVAVLAALDSVFGGMRATLEHSFDNLVFITGFFTNAILAAILAYIGDRLGVPLYMAAIFAFGVRSFQNLGIVRRHLLDSFFRKHS